MATLPGRRTEYPADGSSSANDAQRTGAGWENRGALGSACHPARPALVDICSDPADLRLGCVTSWGISQSAEHISPCWCKGRRTDLRGPLPWRNGSGRHAQQGQDGTGCMTPGLERLSLPLAFLGSCCPIRAARTQLLPCHPHPCDWVENADTALGKFHEDKVRMLGLRRRACEW